MEAGQVQQERRDAAPPVTLGEVLYAGGRNAAEPEKEWVRLMRAVAAHDPLALHALYERTHAVVFALALRIARERESAEEIALDVFLGVWRRAAAYDPDRGTVLAWIMNQTRSRALDRLRYEQRKKRLAPGALDELAQPAAPSSAEVLEEKQRAQALRRALAVLSAREREALEIAYFGELTYAQAAARLNQPLGTVKTRIRSALFKLRQALSGEGKP